MEMDRHDRREGLPLFETKEARGRVAYKLFASTIFVGICLIWVYRLTHIPIAGEGRWSWIGLLVVELWFGLYWIITQSARWNVVYRFPYKERLLHRYGDELPRIDSFICTADPVVEPPSLVINTILSVMSYNYPSEKLSIYLSDDGGSELTLHALIEASHFSKHWIPFCKKFMVEPRSPAAYFAEHSEPQDAAFAREWFSIKKLYEDMKNRLDSTAEMGGVSKQSRDQHKGFSEWNAKVTKRDHQSIVQIIIDGRETNAVDNDGNRLPTLVYMAREKRPQWSHNFKAGAMNALIRVSSEISNGPIILNLDCDMYSNSPDIIQEALCFFMDEERGDEIAFVQFPQYYNNTTKNDINGNTSVVVNEIELAGLDGYGAALYLGTGCFHRRESLCGRKYSKDHQGEWNSTESGRNAERTITELEEASKVLVNCSYEKGTPWGKEMGLMYGCPVEDIVTGLAIQCRGWKSVHYNPDKRAFVGVGPATLDQALIQYKRWSEGMFQIFCSHCPFLYGHGKTKLGAQMGYCVYLLWAANSLPTLYYVIVPPLCLLRGIPLFPEVTNLWFLPFTYVFVAKNAFSLAEAFSCKGTTLKAWWNLQRMVVIRRTTSFLFAFIETIIKQLGFSETAFAITAKVVDEDVLKRYEQEIMDFGSSSLMIIIIATLAMLNVFSLVGRIKRLVLDRDFKYVQQLIPQMILCGLMVMINIPVYEALFIRRDKGRMRSSVMFKSIILASLACLMPIY